MEPEQDAQLGGATPTTTPRGRRRLAGALGITLVALTLGVSGAAATSPSPSPAPEASAAPATTPATATAGAITVGGAAPGVTAADQEKVEAAFAAYRTCMREHGVDLPEPVVVKGGDPGTGGKMIGGVGTVVGGAPEQGTVSVLNGVPGLGALPVLNAEPINGPDAAAFQAADAACAPILEAAGIKQLTASAATTAGGPLGAGAAGPGMIGGVAVIGGGVASPADVAAMVAPIRKYAACMREHGVDVPDPVVDEKAGTFELKLEVDPATAEFRAADTACADGSGFGFPVPAVPAGP